MKLGWTWKTGLAIGGSALMIFIGLLLYSHRRLTRLDFSRPTPQVQAIQSQLKEITRLARDSGLPMRKIDTSSVGSKSVESEELDLRRDVNVFESSERRLPVDLQDLQSHVKLPGTWEEKLNKYAEECRIIVLHQESYILNCNRWSPGRAEDLNSVVHSFDSQTGRFYKVQNHVLLYSPPPTTATPSFANENR